MIRRGQRWTAILAVSGAAVSLVAWAWWSATPDTQIADAVGEVAQGPQPADAGPPPLDCGPDDLQVEEIAEGSGTPPPSPEAALDHRINGTLEGVALVDLTLVGNPTPAASIYELSEDGHRKALFLVERFGAGWAAPTIRACADWWEVHAR